MLIYSKDNPIIITEGLKDLLKSHYKTNDPIKISLKDTEKKLKKTIGKIDKKKINKNENDKSIDNKDIIKSVDITNYKIKEPETPEYTQEQINLFKQYIKTMSSSIKRVFTKTLNKYDKLKDSGIFGFDDFSLEDLNNNYWKTDDNKTIYYTFFEPSDDDFDIGYGWYDIWEHKDVKSNKKNARQADQYRESVWDDDEFTDQMDKFIDDVNNEVTKLGYGKSSYDSDWDTGVFYLYNTGTAPKFKEFLKKNNL